MDISLIMKNILSNIITNKAFIAIYIVLSSLLWIPDFMQSEHTLANIFTLLGTFIGVLTNALLLMFITWDIGTTKNKSPIVVLLYMLFAAAFVPLHTMWQTQLVLVIAQIAFLLTLKTYRKPHAVQESFLTTLLLCIVSLIIPDTLLFIPVIWLMMYIEHSFNLRVWLASLIALFVVALYTMLLNYFDIISIGTASYILSRTTIASFNTIHIIALTLLAAESLFAVGFVLSAFRNETNNIQNYTLLFSFALFLASVMMFFPPQHYPSLLIFAILSLTALLTYYFNKKHTFSSGILFIVHSLLWITLGIVSQIIP